MKSILRYLTYLMACSIYSFSYAVGSDEVWLKCDYEYFLTPGRAIRNEKTHHAQTIMVDRANQSIFIYDEKNQILNKATYKSVVNDTFISWSGYFYEWTIDRRTLNWKGLPLKENSYEQNGICHIIESKLSKPNAF